MTPDQLRQALTGYAETVRTAWTPDTSHPSFEGADGSPVGQCGVTAAWLQRRLADDHTLFTYYCEGTAYIGADWTPVAHVWLAGLDGSVYDLTAGQFPAPVMAYVAMRQLSPDETRHQPVRDRVRLLEEAL